MKDDTIYHEQGEWFYRDEDAYMAREEYREQEEFDPDVILDRRRDDRAEREHNAE